MNTSPPPRRETIDMLREAVRYTDSAMTRAAKVQREIPLRRTGCYSVVTPRSEWKPSKA